MTDILQRVAMKAVIVRDNKILVLREASAYKDGSNIGRYDFPGGRIEPGEHFKDGLSREVKEETGLTVTIGEPVFVAEWMPVIAEVQNHIVAVFLFCEVTSPLEIILSQDHDDYQWVDQASADDLNLTSASREAIAAYFKKHQSR